jgi:hypothetical protein
MDRRTFIKRAATTTLGMVVGYSSKPLSAREITNFSGIEFSKLEEEIKKNIKDGIEAEITINYHKNWLKNSDNIERTLDINYNLVGEFRRGDDLKGLGLNKNDIYQIKKFTDCLASPYNIIALVGSAVGDKKDKYPQDLDILLIQGAIKNSKFIPYMNPKGGDLFDNQEMSLALNDFRYVEQSKLIEFYKKVNPEFAKKVQENGGNGYENYDHSFYISEPHEGLLPIHLLTPKALVVMLLKKMYQQP